MKKALVEARFNKVSTSAKKVAPVMDLVRGKDLEEAKIILAFDPTKAAKLVLKTLKSAEANAKNNLKIDTSNLYVSAIWVGNGKTIRTGRPGSKGHFDPILKRSAHIYVGLDERKAR